MINTIKKELEKNDKNVFLFNIGLISRSLIIKILDILNNNGFECDTYDYIQSDKYHVIALLNNSQYLRAIIMYENIKRIKQMYRQNYNFFVIEYTDILNEDTINYVNNLFKDIL